MSTKPGALHAAAVLSVIYLATDSDALGCLALLAVVMFWRPMQRSAKRPLPPYPEPAPSCHPLAWQRWAWLPGSVLLGAAIGEFTYRVGGGVTLWAFVGVVAPLCFLQNRYGVQQRPKPSRRTRLRRLLRRPRKGASG